jgi:hypothetical protein
MRFLSAGPPQRYAAAGGSTSGVVAGARLSNDVPVAIWRVEPRSRRQRSTSDDAATVDSMWEIEFFEHPETGKAPVIEWMEGDLDRDKHLAVVAAVEQVLAKQGLDVCETEWGKQLGKGLAEFRIRHSADEIVHMFDSALETSSPEGRRKSPEKILLRVFFHAHGKKIILLIHGYDKGRHPSARRQQSEIEKAHQYLKLWKEAQRDAEKAARKAGDGPPPRRRRKK